MKLQDLFSAHPKEAGPIEYDFSFLKSDFDPECVDDDYYANTHEAKMERIDDYVKFMSDHCNLLDGSGVPYYEGKKLRRNKAKEAKFDMICLLNLDKEYKITFYQKLATLQVNNKAVTLFFPKPGEKFDIGIRWN